MGTQVTNVHWLIRIRSRANLSLSVDRVRKCAKSPKNALEIYLYRDLRRLRTIFIEKIMRLVVVKFNHRVPTVQLSSN
jgi:hypothetical protein